MIPFDIWFFMMTVAMACLLASHFSKPINRILSFIAVLFVGIIFRLLIFPILP